MPSTPQAPDNPGPQPAPSSQTSPLRERLEQLECKLTSGPGVQHYEESLRLISEIRELRKRIRTPPPPIDIGSSHCAPARIAYSIDSGNLHWRGDISPLVLRYEHVLSWWLTRYAGDTSRPEESRSFVKTYLSATTAAPKGSRVMLEGGDERQARQEDPRPEASLPVQKIALATENANTALSEYVVHYPRRQEGTGDLITSRLGLAIFLAILVIIAPVIGISLTNFLFSLSGTGIALSIVVAGGAILAVYLLARGYDRRSIAAEYQRALKWFSSPEGVLLRSAKSGDIEALQTALRDGAPPDASGATGVTPLMLASAGGHARIAHLLLKAGADPNRFDSAGSNALVHAVANERLAVVQQLIKHGAIPEARNGEGKTVLIAIIDQAGFGRQPAHVEILRTIVADGRNIETPDNKGRRPLIAAVESGSPEIVRMLLEAGADPNSLYAAPNEYQGDVTPLMVASYFGNGACVEELLRGGADHRVRSIADISPLMVAAGACKDDKAREDELAGRSGHMMKSRVQAVRSLIAAGADVNARDEFGGTAVMYATHMDRDAAIRVLAAAGADLDAAEAIRVDYVQQGPILESRVSSQQSGITALMYAAGEGRTMAAIALVELGANIELKNSDGQTALDIAKRTNPHTAAAMSKAIQTRAPRSEPATG